MLTMVEVVVEIALCANDPWTQGKMLFFSILVRALQPDGSLLDVVIACEVALDYINEGEGRHIAYSIL
jgi:hypothetical protein